MSLEAPYLYRLAAALLLPAICVWYASLVARSLQPGWSRLVLCLPVFAFNFCSPSLFDERKQLISNLVCCLCFVWLANFKVFALCLGRGALSRRLTPLQLYAIYIAPITPRDELEDVKADGIPRVKSAGTLGEHGGGAAQLTLRFIAKAAGLITTVNIISEHADKLPRLALEYIYAVALYCFLGFVMDGPASLLTSMIGLQIAPHFNKPFFSESLTSFWGKRWNLTISNCLRGPIYDPMYEGRWVNSPQPHKGGSPTRRALGMAACFVVSGLMHELIYWYMMGTHTRHWAWLLFFTGQIPLLALEGYGKKLLKQQHWRIPNWLSITATMAILLWLADTFFFPPCLTTGLADRVVDAIKANVNQLVALFL